MKNVTVFLLLFQSIYSLTSQFDLTIQLEDEITDDAEVLFFTNDYEELENGDNPPLIRFVVDEKYTTSLSLHNYYSESKLYELDHSPLHIDIYENDKVVISFDDNKDNVFDDRAAITTSLDQSSMSYLFFKHANDEEKNLSIGCRFVVTLTSSGYQLNLFYNIKSKGIVEIGGQKTTIEFIKSLSKDIYVDGQRVRLGNPFRIGKAFYELKSYDPIDNTISLRKLDPSDKLYGTAKNLHVKKELLENAFSYHKVSKTKIQEKDYHVLYFWGHWCQPCIDKMEMTSKLLNSLNNNVAVYNVSLITHNYEDEVAIVKNIVKNYNLPGYAIIEKHSKSTDTYPLIELLDNRTYPNFIVLDSEYKILFISEKSNVPIEDYFKKFNTDK